MEPTDIMTEILIGIRDEIRGTNARIEETNTRLDEMRADLSKRIVESEIRTATAITDLAGTAREVAAALRSQGDVRPRLEKCERDIDDLRRRILHGQGSRER